MAHQITGIARLRLAVGDPESADRLFRKLGFQVDSGAGDSGVRLGAQSVCWGLPAEPEQNPVLGIGSRDRAATLASIAAAGAPLAPDAGKMTPLPEDLTAGLPFLIDDLGAAEGDGADHDNTACRLVSVTAVIGRPEAAMPGLSRLFGPAACTPTDEMVTVRTGNALLFLVTAGGFDDLHPSIDIVLPAPPAIVAATFGVRSIARVSAWLAEQGMTARAWGGHLCLSSRDCPGIGMEFVEV